MNNGRPDHLVELRKEISQCALCLDKLEHGVRPVFDFRVDSKIVIIGQAPGIKVHNSGIPWDDKSGDNLRSWMGIDSSVFYDPTQIAIIPMGFCYPGKGKSGDLPPRKECAPQWHSVVLPLLKNVKMTLLIGKYAQDYYLKALAQPTLTETVRNFKDYLPNYLVLPHPSPRNNIWMKKNPWFAEEVLPELKKYVAQALNK